jgi:hypothetical protein
MGRGHGEAWGGSWWRRVYSAKNNMHDLGNKVFLSLKLRLKLFDKI